MWAVIDGPVQVDASLDLDASGKQPDDLCIDKQRERRADVPGSSQAVADLWRRNTL